MDEQKEFTPRVWMSRSGVSVEKFVDAANARASFPDANRLTGGLGVVAKTGGARERGNLSLHGSLDVEHIFDGEVTTVEVSGEKLESESGKTRILIGLGGAYHQGRLSLSAEVSMAGLNAEKQEYSAVVNLGIRF